MDDVSLIPHDFTSNIPPLVGTSPRLIRSAHKYLTAMGPINSYCSWSQVLAKGQEQCIGFLGIENLKSSGLSEIKVYFLRKPPKVHRIAPWSKLGTCGF